jgi:hypothetical protein
MIDNLKLLRRADVFKTGDKVLCNFTNHQQWFLYLNFDALVCLD